MKIKIIRGKNKIGGCTVEIASTKARILIDFGTDLPDGGETPKPFFLEGLTDNNPMYDAVFITHSHADHCGLINSINKNIKVFMEEKSLEIYNITASYMPNTEPIKKERINTFKLEREYNLEKQEKIVVEDIIITPLIADHSSYNSCMYLIECDGKCVLHTGDFRNHGKKKQVLSKVLEYLKNKKIDVLIIEGTTLGRKAEKDICDLVNMNIIEINSEDELKDALVDLFKVNKERTQYNQVFFLQSSTNIDRTNTLCHACIESNKKFVIDMPTEKLIPICIDKIKVDYKKVFTWTTDNYQNKHKEEEKDFNSNFFPYFVMQVKSSMYSDIKKIMSKIKPYEKRACLIYSMWDGYLDRQPKLREFISNVKALGIDFGIIHVSGHASIETLEMVEKTLKPRYTMVIHTTNREEGKKLFDSYYEKEELEI